MSKKPRPKKPQLQRAAPSFPPGGALMYVTPQQLQNVYSQTFYGGKTNNIATGQTALFSPGTPLIPQQGVNPNGQPVAFRFPVAYNTFPVDRTLQKPDIPSFEQLRRFARMYSGVTLCERFWMDMVPRMTLDIKLKKQYVDAGAEEKDYQKEITYFKNFFAKPDGKNDLHTWIRKALREQTQIDELYLYKHKTRGNKMLGLWIVDGSQIKPLLDDWGMQPDPPGYAYQQYPWGIPGMQYTSSQMIHYQESPAAETPYGFSRVERIILEVNQALRKKKKDLAHFTEGNIPQSFMEVPENSDWTPDQIDAFAQSFNSMVAGNEQQQVRMLFLQPGMKYITAEQYQLLPDFDKFILNICVACYGISMAELSFTEDVNKSSGESQEDMTYRRTIGPLALMYALILTMSMNTDFPSQYKGEMFEASFGGYEENDDEEVKSKAITTYTNAGILGLSDAAKLANLPVDPDAPKIGRVVLGKDGPIFLDDIATDEMRKAAAQATLAGFQMATNPPEDNQEEQEDGKNTQQQQKTTNSKGSSQSTQKSTDKSTKERSVATRDSSQDNAIQEDAADYRRWRTRAIEDVKQGRLQRSFTSDVIPEYVQAYLSYELALCKTTDDVRALFKRVQEHQMEVVGS